MSPVTSLHKSSSEKLSLEYIPPRLVDYNGDLSKRWYIRYYVYDEAKGGMTRHRVYTMNKYSTKKDRYKAASEYMKEIKTLIKDGYFITKRVEENNLGEEDTIDLNKVSLVEALTWAKQKKFQKGIAKITEGDYETHLGAFTRWLKLKGLYTIPFRRLTKRMIHEFFDYLEARGIENKTYNNYLTSISALFNLLKARTGQLAVNPCIDVERKDYVSGETHLPYTKEQFKKIIAEARKRKKNSLIVMIYTLYYCFMRPSEVLKMKRKHILFDRNVIEIPGRANTKIQSRNYRQMPSALKEILLEFGIDKLEDEDYIIASKFSKHKKPAGKDFAWSAHSEILKHLKLNKKGYTLYGYKHTGNIEMFMQFRDIMKNMLQNGHDNPETTRIYLRQLGVIADEDILDFK